MQKLKSLRDFRFVDCSDWCKVFGAWCFGAKHQATKQITSCLGDPHGLAPRPRRRSHRRRRCGAPSVNHKLRRRKTYTSITIARADVTDWPRWESNPHGGCPPGDFKSPVSAIPPRGRGHFRDCLNLSECVATRPLEGVTARALPDVVRRRMHKPKTGSVVVPPKSIWYTSVHPA